MIWIIRMTIGFIIMKIFNFIWDLLRIEERIYQRLHRHSGYQAIIY